VFFLDVELACFVNACERNGLMPDSRIVDLTRQLYDSLPVEARARITVRF
jgi:hypothetical protein